MNFNQLVAESPIETEEVDPMLIEMQQLRHNLPSAVFHYLTTQLDVFVRLQRVRYGTTTDDNHQTNNNNNMQMQQLFHVASPSALEHTARAQLEADRGRSYGQWLELYEQNIHTFAATSPLMREAAVVSLWQLTRFLLDVKTLTQRSFPERLSQHAAAPGEAYCYELVEPLRPLLSQWYGHNFMDEVTLQQNLHYAFDEFPESFLYATDNVKLGDGAHLLDCMEQLVYCGRGGAAARLVDTFYRLLSQESLPHSAQHFTPAVHNSIAAVKRLLIEAEEQNDNEVSFTAWRKAANDGLHEVKNAFAPLEVEEGEPAEVTLTALLFEKCLRLFIICSGDDEALLRRCCYYHAEDGLGLTMFIVGYCNLLNPFAELGEVQNVFDTALDVLQSGHIAGNNLDRQKWYYDILSVLLKVEILGDFVQVAETINEVATAVYPWNPAAWEDQDNNSLIPYNGNEASGTAPLTAGEQCTRRLLLSSLAAHLADIAAPPCVADVASYLSYTFTRNHVIKDYFHLFSGVPRGWKVAGLYAAYSPLLNPVEVYNVMTYAGRAALTEKSVYHALMGLLRTAWSKESPHQRFIFRRLMQLYPSDPAVSQYFDMLEHYYRKSFDDIHRYLITECFTRGDVTRAVCLAVENGLTDEIVWELRVRLIAAGALEDVLLAQVGKAVEHGFVALDGCASLELLCSLKLCAALSNYVQAARAVGRWEELQRADHTRASPLFRVAEALRAGAWAHTAVLDLIVAIGHQTHFDLHPSVLCTVMERGCETLLLMRDWMKLAIPPHHHNNNSYHQKYTVMWVQLTNRFVPPATQLLEVMGLQFRSRINPKRIMAIREKLLRLVDTPTY